MVTFYEFFKRSSVEVIVAKWLELQEQKGREEAVATLSQLAVDCLTECSLNRTERCHVPSKCTDNMFEILIKNLLKREFRCISSPEIQKKCAQFLCELLPASGTTSWYKRIEMLLKSCSKNIETVFFASNMSVKFLEGLVMLRNGVGEGFACADSGENSINYLDERCAVMVDTIANCCQYTLSVSNVAHTLFPLIQRKPFFMEINGIDKLFLGITSEHISAALKTLNMLINATSDADIQHRVLGICTSPIMVEHLERLMIDCAWKRIVKIAYELAVDVQEHYPLEKIFSTEALARVFDSDVQANGTAKLIGRLLYQMNNDPNNAHTFIRHSTNFFMKYSKDSDSCKYLIEACPNIDAFTDWESIFEYITQVRKVPDHRAHTIALCRIVVESVNLLADRIRTPKATNQDPAINREKMEQIVKLLPIYLRRYIDDHEVIGQLLFAFRYIDLKIYLRFMKPAEVLLKVISKNVGLFTDFIAQCNAIEIFKKFLAFLDFDFDLVLQPLYLQMLGAHDNIETNAANEIDWNEASTKFMRFSAWSFLDTGIQQETIAQVANMCSEDLFDRKTYAAMKNAPIFGYNLIMLSSCYRMSSSRSIPDVNRFVTFLLNKLDRSGNAIDFVEFATFTSLCKLFHMSSSCVACVHKMIQFAFDKLKAIDTDRSILEQCPNAWAIVTSMFDELSNGCLQYAEDTDLLASVIEYCLAHRKETRKQFGLQFMRAVLPNGEQYFGRTIAKVLYDTPLIASKQQLIDNMNEMLANQTKHVQNQIRKEIVQDIVARKIAIGRSTEGQTTAAMKNADKTTMLVLRMGQKSADLGGSPISIRFENKEGQNKVARINPSGAVAKPTRRGRRAR